jgi:hypothetical protein
VRTLARDVTTPTAERARAAKVLGVIRQHVGRASAVSMYEISQRTAVSPRDVQAIVKFLVEERGVPIGSATSEPFGYYVIRSEDELQDNYRHFVRRGVSNLRHASAFKKASIVGPIVGQLEIEVEDKR